MGIARLPAVEVARMHDDLLVVTVSDYGTWNGYRKIQLSIAEARELARALTDLVGDKPPPGPAGDFRH